MVRRALGETLGITRSSTLPFTTELLSGRPACFFAAVLASAGAEEVSGNAPPADPAWGVSTGPGIDEELRVRFPASTITPTTTASANPSPHAHAIAFFTLGSGAIAFDRAAPGVDCFRCTAPATSA